MPGAANALPFFPKHPKIERSKVKIGDWRLDTAHNRFSGELVCRLRAQNKRQFYEGGAIGFRFKEHWDVHQAVYRLDGGAPQQWRDDLPELVRIGAPIDQGGVENASAGIVWIPWRRLAEVSRVAIQPRADRRAKVFQLRGLRGLYQVAVQRGCAPDSRFVR